MTRLPRSGRHQLKATAAISARLLLQGQTNFVRMLWKFNSVYNPKRQLSDHARPVKYEMKLPTLVTDRRQLAKKLYVLPANARAAQDNKLMTGEAQPA